MKAKFFGGSRFLIMLTTIAISSFMLASCDKDDDNQVDNRPYTISGNASGSQMVPSVAGTGTGTITGSYDPATNQLTYTSNWNGLTGAPTSGGFYNGASGAAGTAIGDPWTFDAGATGTGSNTGTMTLTSEQASQLTGGNWYYSYGTSTNPGGEVRGQISATR
jgi:hypothetical protein